MSKPKKVYCEECKFYTWRKGDGVCFIAGMVLGFRGNYRSPPSKRKEYCWEKNERNNCREYSAKERDA